MVTYEYNCVNCDIPCRECGRKHQAVRVCDKCGSHEKLYIDNDEELCEYCLGKKIREYINDDFLAFISDLFEELCEYFDIEEISNG